MIRFRLASARGLFMFVALGFGGSLAGCGGDDDGQALQTEEMEKSLQNITENYGQQYSERYRSGQGPQ